MIFHTNGEHAKHYKADVDMRRIPFLWRRENTNSCVSWKFLKTKTKNDEKCPLFFLNLQPERVDELKRGNVFIPNGRIRVKIK